MENTLYITTKNLVKILNTPYSKIELETLSSFEKINEHPSVEKLNKVLNAITTTTNIDNNSKRARNYFLFPLAMLSANTLSKSTDIKVLISKISSKVAIQKTTTSKNLFDIFTETDVKLKKNNINLICNPVIHGVLQYESAAVLIDVIYNSEANDTSINLSETLDHEVILNAELKAISLLNDNINLETIILTFYDPNISFRPESTNTSNSSEYEDESIYHPYHYIIYTREKLLQQQEEFDKSLSSNFNTQITDDPALKISEEDTIDCGEGDLTVLDKDNNINFNNFYKKLRNYIKSDIDVERVHTSESKGGRDVKAPEVNFINTSIVNDFGSFTFKKLKIFQNIFLGMSIFKVSVEEIYEKSSLDQNTGKPKTDTKLSNKSTIHLGAIYNYHKFYQNIKEYFINETTSIVHDAIDQFNIEQELLDDSEKEIIEVDKDKLKFIFLAMMAPLVEKGPSNVSAIFRTYSNNVMEKLKKELKDYLEEHTLYHPNNNRDDPSRKFKLNIFIDKFLILLVKALNKLDQSNVMLGNSINSVLFDIATSPIILGKFFRLVKVIPPAGQSTTDLSNCLFVLDFDNRLQLRSAPNYSGTIFFEDLLEKLRKGIIQHSNLDRLLSDGYTSTMIRTQFRYLESSVFSNLLNEVKDEINLD
jgi:hypothetical protein